MLQERQRGARELKDKANKKRNRIVEFFFPKNFKGSMIESQFRSDRYMTLGADRIKRKRGMFWYNFWSWIPIWGSFIMYREGKKEDEENAKGRKG